MFLYFIFFSNKVVSDGAISYYIDHFVQTRVSKITYGIDGFAKYDPSNPEHQNVPVYTPPSGAKQVVAFFVILPEVSYLLVLNFSKKEKTSRILIIPFIFKRIRKYPKRMKYDEIFIWNLKVIKSYRLPI